ncbi:hypothetical protein AACH06_25540 [Ideonella sp. DXS29W]|uniref:Uncharacterized protein n=1 Tax=Ideonella lacteola TaxID=2984193 RepID=A0ABU9BWS9_9BURK
MGTLDIAWFIGTVHVSLLLALRAGFLSEVDDDASYRYMVVALCLQLLALLCASPWLLQVWQQIASFFDSVQPGALALFTATVVMLVPVVACLVGITSVVMWLGDQLSRRGARASADL